MTFTQHCEYTKSHWIVYFKRTHLMVCDLYLDKAVFKKYTICNWAEMFILNIFDCSPYANPFSILLCFALFPRKLILRTASTGISPLCKWSNHWSSKPGHFWERTMEVNQLSWANWGFCFCWGLVPAVQAALLRATAPARPCSCLLGSRHHPLSLSIRPRCNDSF